jgi:hypothetical protein
MAKATFLLLGNRLLVKRAAWSPLWFLLVMLILEIIALMPSNTMIDSAPGNMYFWFLLGMVVRMADLQRAHLATASAAPQPYRVPAAPLFAFDRPRSASS